VITGRGLLRARARLLALVLGLVLSPLVLPAAPAHADYVSLCTGYAACRDAGYGSAGYAAHNDRMYWRMYSGHNCTNYAAYRMVEAGMPDSRPWSGVGNAENWGHAMAYLTDSTPMVGSVAWWDANVYPVGSSGHVAYVERVVSSNEIWISDDNWGGDFHWHRVTRSNGGWPSGFIHFRDVALRNRQAPTVTGTPQVGETLTAGAGTWTPAADTWTYQWFADGQAIRGATDPTLLLGPGRVGQQITVQVAASARGYAAATDTSAATAPVAPGVITTVAEPAVTGEALVGQVLTASRGSYDPGSTTKTVQWFSDDRPIPGATAWRLQLDKDQAGTVVRAEVSVTRAGYEPATVTSAPTDSVLGGTVQVTSPFTVSGTPMLGQPLQVVPGTVDPSDAVPSYTWLRNGAPIPGATGPTYTPRAEDVGAQISVRADLARQGYKPTSQTTEATAPVRTLPQLEVTAVGKPGRARVTVAVTAPGVPLVRGRVTVYVGGTTVEVGLVDGRRTVVIPDLRPGSRKVVVRYLGQGLVDPGSYRGTVVVPRAH
jgi:surface antigen